MLLVSGYTFATGKGPGSSDVNSTVREKIATAIGTADIKGHGQIVLKFGVDEKNNLQILNIEGNDKMLSKAVKEALAGAKIVFPKGSTGTYKIKVFVNENAEFFSYNAVRDQVYSAVDQLKPLSEETVKIKFRVINPSTVKVLKAECSDAKLAQQVKKAIESQEINVPKELSGDYTIAITYK